MFKRFLAIACVAAVTASYASPCLAQDDKKKGGPKPYDEVITEGAVTDAGLFITHVLDDKLYYEIPTGALGAEMIWVTQIAGTQAGHSYAGMPVTSRVVRWEQRGDRILLREVKYSIRADTDDAIKVAVEATNIAPIIQVFEVAAYGKDKAAVVDVTSVFTSDTPEFSAVGSLGARSMDSKRSFIEQVKAFPENIEVKVLGTFPLPGEGERARTSQVTALIHHSMVKLPEEPMTPRVHDDRVGFFSVGFTDYADDSDHEAASVRYITRWRLEKKDPEAEVSEPVKPIGGTWGGRCRRSGSRS
jgi:hypothetical protein